MKADITRSTFDPRKHFAAVLLQQGRVPMDADFNEQAELTLDRQESGTRDLVGPCGAPLQDDGFRLVAGAADLSPNEQARPGNSAPPPLPALQGPSDFYLTAGRYYVDGILCLNERIVPFSLQPDLPGAALPQQNGQPQEGTYLAYLDAWRRGITALEDPAIREVALGGPDTGTRARTVWQVRLFRLGPASLPPDQANCLADAPDLDAEIAAGTGRVAARAEPGAQSSDPCIVAPGAGFRRLENQLYRLEVHEGGSLGTATFKWSRENGSVVSRWLGQQGANNEVLRLATAGRDSVLGFASGQWVELTDDDRELQALPGTLVRVVQIEGTTLTVDPTTATGSLLLADFPRNPKVRRWDQSDVLQPADAVTFLDLESGVQVRFEQGSYRAGDYWLIPARTATGDIEWERDAAQQPVALPPRGVAHRYCRLAVMRFDGTQWTDITDCRPLFPPATDLVSLLFVGGDGQEAAPGTALPHPLQVRVARGEWPVAGRRVRFTVVDGDGSLSPSQAVTTAAPDGIAQCEWTLGSTAPAAQRVEAVLLDAAGNPVPGQVVAFNASQVLAEGQTQEPVIQVQGLRLKVPDLVLNNGMLISPEGLAGGIAIQCSAAVDPASVRDGSPPNQFEALRDQPTCFVTAEIPYPLTSTEIADWSSTAGTPVAIGYHPLVLRAQTLADGSVITWIPVQTLIPWLRLLLEQLVTQKSGHDRVLARLTLKGNFITQEGKPDVFLDGDSFRDSEEPGIQFPSGDNRRGGDFEMWFWISNTTPPSSLQVQPGSLFSGNVVATLQLTVPATGTVTVNLLSSNQAVAQVPATVTIPPGQSKITFNVAVAGGLTQENVTITASLPGATISQTIIRLGQIITPGPIADPGSGGVLHGARGETGAAGDRPASPSGLQKPARSKRKRKTS